VANRKRAPYREPRWRSSATGHHHEGIKVLVSRLEGEEKEGEGFFLLGWTSIVDPLGVQRARALDRPGARRASITRPSGAHGVIGMKVVVCAGGCGCRASRFLAGTDADVVVVGSELDVGYAEGVPGEKRIVVNAGDPRGGFRDYRTTLRRIKSDVRPLVKKLVEGFDETGRAPAVVFGLGGAVGLATAALIAERVPLVAVMVLPSHGEPCAREARERFDFLMDRGRAVVPVAVRNMDPDSVEPVRVAAEFGFEFAGSRADKVANDAGNGVAYLENRVTTVSELRSYLDSLMTESATLIGGVADEDERFELTFSSTNGGGERKDGNDDSFRFTDII